MIRSSSIPLHRFFFIPATLALITCLSIFLYISSTSKLFSTHGPQSHQILLQSQHHNFSFHVPPEPIQQTLFAIGSSKDEDDISSTSQLFSTHHPQSHLNLLQSQHHNSSSDVPPEPMQPTSLVIGGIKDEDDISSTSQLSSTHHRQSHQILQQSQYHNSSLHVPPQPIQQTLLTIGGSKDENKGKSANEKVFHDRDIFLEDYKEMNRSFKIYVYPHTKKDPHAQALLPVNFEPGGNYASESYFKKVLMQSHFITKDPSEADLFLLPFSIASLRYDRSVGVGGIQDFVRSYIHNISQKYPYWNRTGGTDHFYVACHSVGRSAMEKAEEVKLNSIQVVCSSSYFLSGYVTHKDVSMPQIWPRKGNPPDVALSKRKKLAFFAGAVNSPVRKKLLEVWKNDSEIFVHYGRLPTPYSVELLGSKFCLHVKGFEVNTARIGDAIYYGCVPVILAEYYDLPFTDILNWKSFSLVVATSDIPLLKKILHGISPKEYATLQKNVLEVRKHFRWNKSPVDYDVFYMVMYELWLRRSSVRYSTTALLDSDQLGKTSCI